MAFILLSIAAVFISSVSCSDIPKIYNHSALEIVVKNGETAKLECHANGSPSPKVTWFRTTFLNDLRSENFPNGEKTFQGNVLEIPSINQSYRGKYSCVAENGHQLIDSRSFTLEVQSAPILQQSVRINNYEERIIELSCKTIAYPVTPFRWFKNNVELKDYDKYRLAPSIYDTNFDITDSSIAIPIEVNDYAGTYKCVNENEFGKTQHVFDPIEVPSIKSNE